jgi:hypothetical protein
MTNPHSPADDVVYDLVSIQYHALKAASHYDQYFTDAAEHPDVQEFLRQIQQQDFERAQRCHQLLGELTGVGMHTPS